MSLVGGESAPKVEMVVRVEEDRGGGVGAAEPWAPARASAGAVAGPSVGSNDGRWVSDG